MNTLMGIIWGLIDPEMFAAVADTLEDVMQVCKFSFQATMNQCRRLLIRPTSKHSLKKHAILQSKTKKS
jgi:hypothetical protein